MSCQIKKHKYIIMRIYEIITESNDYRGQHSAPGPEGAPLSDLTANGVFPADVYSSQGPQYYGSYSPGDNAVFGMIHAYRNKPNKPVRIYRAVPAPQNTAKMLSTLEKQMASFMKRGRAPADSKFRDPNDWYTWASRERERLANLPQEKAEQLTINPGDWVSIDRAYAVDHGESALNGDYKILSKTVPAGQVFTNGDSIREWGWSP